ncbi:MAG: Pvc16 family protein [Sideroxyarcus sp.]
MFRQLDKTMLQLLKAAPAPALKMLHDAEISFVTPDDAYTPAPHELNLFLYEVKENRELRNAAPSVAQQNSMSVRKRSPLRVDCAYMVTAWCTDATNLHDKTFDSHELLGQAFNWLSRFPVVPDDYLQTPGLSVSSQVFSPPTMVAQMDGAKSAGEFWHALGIPPRPYFNLVVTITMDLDQQVEDSIVTTITSNYNAGQSASADERVLIGGRVLNAHGGSKADADPVADAWVRVEETGETQVTNELGQFVFTSLRRGKQYTLRARVIGLGEWPGPGGPKMFVPSPSGEYDIVFP